MRAIQLEAYVLPKKSRISNILSFDDVLTPLRREFVLFNFIKDEVQIIYKAKGDVSLRRLVMIGSKNNVIKSCSTECNKHGLRLRGLN